MVVPDDEIDRRGDLLRRVPGAQHGRGEAPEEEARGGDVAVVALVAHVQGLGDDRLDRDLAALLDRRKIGGDRRQRRATQEIRHDQMVEGLAHQRRGGEPL